MAYFVCLMYTKLSFGKADGFSCHFASLKYTTYGKKNWDSRSDKIYSRNN